jgi:Sec7-like guanine-nucleotide exchange factor
MGWAAESSIAGHIMSSVPSAVMAVVCSLVQQLMQSTPLLLMTSRRSHVVQIFNANSGILVQGPHKPT